MDQIAADADVSTPSLYNYFGSKDELLAAIIVEDVAEGLARAEKLVAKPPKDARAAYVGLIRIHFQTFDQIERSLLRRFTAHAIGREDRAERDYFGLESQLLVQIEHMTITLHANGSLPGISNAKGVARTVFSIANSEYYFYISDDDADSDSTVKAIAMQLQFALAGLS